MVSQALCIGISLILMLISQSYYTDLTSVYKKAKGYIFTWQ